MEENKITVEEMPTANENQNTEVKQTEQTIDVEEVKLFEVETNEVLVTSGELSENLNHALLNNRELPNQHPIIAIEGLQVKLDDIERLKPVRSNLSGHADYYLWGEEATEDNPLGPGYFVRLGEDGMIHKCTNETIVLRPKDLPLDTDEYGNVIIYALVGNITTADITKHYVVGTEVPYDIYAYDGIEYVQKSAYSYDGEQVIKTCHTTDILGVTVSAAGFVGNDENIIDTHTSAKATDINYALVATTGVVDVLCSHDVVVGDYVFPTVSGLAAKSTGSYGYLVTALVQNGVVVQEANKEEMLYARIVLSQSVVNAKKVSDNVDYLLGETKRLDENITTFGNTAETALKRTEELAEAAKNTASDASNKAQNAVDAATGAQNAVNNMITSNSNTAEIAKQAQKDVETAINTANSIKDDAIKEAKKAAVEAAQGNTEFVKALEYRLDEYTVGQYSQAYGLTYEQAKLLLPIGTTFIPLDEDPISTGTRQEYKEVYAGGEGADVEQTFTVGYSYVWGGQNWLIDKTVLITRTPTTQTEGDYWFATEDYDGTDYKRGALYRWENGKWVEKAVRIENTMSRTIAHLYHEDDTIRQSVSSIDGKVAAVETKVTETDARVGLVASVPTELVGIKPGNYYVEDDGTEVFDKITTYDDLNTTNYIDKAQSILTNQTELYYDTKDKCIYYCVGEKLPYVVYQATLSDNTVVFKNTEDVENHIVPVSYDGVNLYKINTSSIINAVNKDGSNITLNADRINFGVGDYTIDASHINMKAGDITLEGYVKFEDLEANGTTEIDGSRIITGQISADRIDTSKLTVKTENLDGTISADQINTTGLHADYIEVLNDNDEIIFKADKANNFVQINAANIDGQLTAEQIDATGITATGVDITGKVVATRGTIGSWELLNLGAQNNVPGAYFKSANSDVGIFTATSNLGGNEIINFWAGYDKSKNITDGSYQMPNINNTEPPNFFVTNKGQLKAENADISGNIQANTGKIGNLSIVKNGLASKGFLIYANDSGKGEIIIRDGTGRDSFYITDNQIGMLNAGSLEFSYDSASTLVNYYAELTLVGNGTGASWWSVTVYNNSDEKTQLNLEQDKSFTFIGKDWFRSIEYTITIPRGESQGSCNVVSPIGKIREYYFADSQTNTLKFVQSKNIQSSGKIYVNGSLDPTSNAGGIGNTSNPWPLGAFTNLYVNGVPVSTSDKNKKNSIQTIDEKYSLLFDNLRPVTFKFNDGTSDRTHIGLIAQEVKEAAETVGLTTQEVAAYCEWEEGDTTTCGVRYSELVALNIYEIQKLKARVKELEDKLSTVQND